MVLYFLNEKVVYFSNTQILNMRENSPKPQEIVVLNKACSEFDAALRASDTNRGPLWRAWHYVQVYSTWGLRIPSENGSLKTYLRIDDPSNYPFFGTMLQAYGLIHASSKEFQTKLFPKL